MIYKKLTAKNNLLKKLFFVLIMLTLSTKIAYCKDMLEVNFFADNQNLKIEDRQNIIQFIKGHKSNSEYEFEIHSLSDPLNTEVDVERLINVQGVFREHGVAIDELTNAKIRFISGKDQKIIIIRVIKK
ncbi:MAG: hypothetical protein GY793_03910 [Proteobacteria bacterium]|nr:hypothetical protein [Pseudomonadota bacterium]